MSDPLNDSFPASFDQRLGNYVPEICLEEGMRIGVGDARPSEAGFPQALVVNGPMSGEGSQEPSAFNLLTRNVGLMEGATQNPSDQDGENQNGELLDAECELDNIIAMSDLGNEGSTKRKVQLSKVAASLNSLANLGNDTLDQSRTPGSEGGEGALRIEMKAKHKCHECGKEFKRAHNLKIHGRLHSGDKPYGCPFAHCTKEFRWKSSIVSHLNWHRTKKGEHLPGFDGTASGYDAQKQKEKYVVQGRSLPREKQARSEVAALTAAKKLERALALQSQAQARHNAALKEVEEAVVAASQAKVAADLAVGSGLRDHATTSTGVNLNELLKEWAQKQKQGNCEISPSLSSENEEKDASLTIASRSPLSPQTIGSSSVEGLQTSLLPEVRPSLETESTAPNSFVGTRAPVESQESYLPMSGGVIPLLDKPNEAKVLESSVFDLFP